MLLLDLDVSGMPDREDKRKSSFSVLKVIGPGIVVAATGIGAGDLVAASVAGASYGVVLAWAVLLGALFKYVLNVGIAKWQLSTGTSMIEAWLKQFPKPVSWYFLIYLVLWSFIVGGALTAACGLAGHALFPRLSIVQSGIIHALIGLALVWFGKYRFIEHLMKFFIGLLFVVIVLTGILLLPEMRDIQIMELVPRFPAGSFKFTIGVIGGVGGSVTLLSYGYWMKEKGWNHLSSMRVVRIDLLIAYTFTALFGLAILVISAGVKPELASGNEMVLALGDRIESVIGKFGKIVFLIGFWGAVFSSLLGVWQGIPYLFADFVQQSGLKVGKSYKGFLLFISLTPISLLFINKPVWLIITYSVIGAFFMPFLAGSLLFLGKKIKNSPITKIVLWAVLIFFIIALGKELINLCT